MLRIFICMPYGDHLPADDRLRNVDAAMVVFNRLADIGAMPYLPHLSHFLDEKSSRPRAYWLALAKEWLLQSHCVLACCEITEGMRAEISVARTLYIPVFYDVLPDAAIEALLKAYSCDRCD